MMKSMATRKVPTESYGVLTRNVTSTSLDLCVEELSIKGFTILNGGYSSEVIDEIKESSVTAKKKYVLCTRSCSAECCMVIDRARLFFFGACVRARTELVHACTTCA